MIFKTIKSEGLAHLSYLLGDAGECAVIDPRRDIEVYLEIARAEEVRITHILETHIHADFVSGSRELAARTGATIYGGRVRNKKQGDYGFEIHSLDEGDTVQVGAIALRALHTPGHSSEHISYVACGGGEGAEHDWAVFSGDTLFAGEVGRPDLEPGANHRELAELLFDSLHQKLMALDDGVEVYPCHGEGSPCGGSIGVRDATSIGYERRYNPRLQIKEKARFVEELLQELREEPMPAYYERLKAENHAGPEILGALPALAPLGADAFEKLARDPDIWVVDAREIAGFAAAHIKDSLNIALRAEFPVWAGRVLTTQMKLVLVADEPAAVSEARIHLMRIGLKLHGYLADGFKAWFNAGKPYASLGLLSVQELHRRMKSGDPGVQIVDVRTLGEWHNGHLDKATHIFVPDLFEGASGLKPEKPVLVYCGSGYRGSIAASILEKHGFEQVYNMPGGISAWGAADYSLVT